MPAKRSASLMSLVALLLWCYYAAQIVFLGAEATRVATLSRGGRDFARLCCEMAGREAPYDAEDLMRAALSTAQFASLLGAKRVGASPKAVLGATLGSVVGIFFGLPGLILGPFIGAVIGELGARRGLDQAAASGVATWVGLLLGTIAKLAIGLAMIGVFAFAWLV